MKLPGKTVYRNITEAGLIPDDQLGVVHHINRHLRKYINGGAQDFLRIFRRTALCCQGKHIGARHGVAGDGAVDIIGTQMLLHQILHNLGGDDVRECGSQLLGSGIIVVAGIEDILSPVAGAHRKHGPGLIHRHISPFGAEPEKSGKNHRQNQRHIPAAADIFFHSAQNLKQVDLLKLFIMGHFRHDGPPDQDSPASDFRA